MRWVGAQPGPGSGARPAGLAAARACALPFLYRAAARGLPTLADSGCQGAGIGIKVPVKNPRQKKGTAPKELDENQRTFNLLLRGLRAPGENAGSPCLPAAGPPFSTSPPALAGPPR